MMVSVPDSDKAITRGSWVLLDTDPRINDVRAPHPNWIKPIIDDAFPAIRPNGDIASAVAADTTSGKPIMKPAAGKTILNGFMLPKTARTQAVKPDKKQIIAPIEINLKLSKRFASLPAATEAKRLPIIIIAK